MPGGEDECFDIGPAGSLPGGASWRCNAGVSSMGGLTTVWVVWLGLLGHVRRERGKKSWSFWEEKGPQMPT